MDGSTHDGMTESVPKDLERLADGEGSQDPENFREVLDGLEERGAVTLEYSGSYPVEIAAHEEGYLVATNVDGSWNRYLIDTYGSNLIAHTLFAESIEAVPPEETRLYHAPDQRAGIHHRIVGAEE